MAEKPDKYARQEAWQKKHMKVVSIKTKKEVAEKFYKLCEGKKVSHVFAEMVETFWENR